MNSRDHIVDAPALRCSRRGRYWAGSFEPRAGQGRSRKWLGLLQPSSIAAEHDQRRHAHRGDRVLVRVERRAALLHAAHGVGEALHREAPRDSAMNFSILAPGSCPSASRAPASWSKFSADLVACRSSRRAPPSLPCWRRYSPGFASEPLPMLHRIDRAHAGGMRERELQRRRRAHRHAHHMRVLLARPHRSPRRYRSAAMSCE